MPNGLISSLEDNFYNQLSACKDLNKLNELRVMFLGKAGIITQQMQKLAALSTEEKKVWGQAINSLKNKISQELTNLYSVLEERMLYDKIQSEKIDISIPARQEPLGKLHIINKVIDNLINIFTFLGFSYVDGPEIEKDWYNFTALNIPETHPARQSHDTFYIKKNKDEINQDKGSDLLLRTQTSNVQIRHMQLAKPPHYIISIGKVYRADYDQTHSPMFHQLECLCIDKNISMANMKWCIQTFLQLFFKIDKLPLRFRSSYFPFTEPSAEVDIQCDRRDKTHIKMGVGNDWLEILGCGMVHSKVLQNVGLSNDDYQGFAFGVGIERLAMLKYNISDLRNFFEGDLRWLRYYGQAG